MARGSTGNVLAAICSFIIPGLGQLFQGRLLAAIVFFVIAVFLWAVGIVTLGLLGFLGIIANLWAAIDAAMFDRGRAVA